MNNRWKGRSGGGERGARPIAVAKYTGTIVLATMTSDLWFDPSVEWSNVVQAVTKPPEWTPFPWPTATPAVREATERLALLKMLRIFEFGAEIRGEQGNEIREQLFARHPGLEEIARSSRSDAFDRIQVDARILDDGSCDGGFEVDSRGRRLPLSTRSTRDFEQFVRDMARADIRDKLGGVVILPQVDK